jgi:ABC-type sugar transport system ATPase subunit/ribose/xylose/arabinose/galactoside ABC-type transport system permease subunit
MTAQAPAVEVTHLSKVFGPTIAVSDVSFELHTGEVLALVGENGAGKSTCVKMLAGLYAPDAGEIRVAGDTVAFANPMAAHERGVAVVHQHPGLFADISAAENIFAGQPLRTRAGLLDHRRMAAEAQRLLDLLGLQRSARTLAGDLRVSEQQIVEIARALAADAKVLILDEPTAALTATEVDRLFGVIDTLRTQGVAMMFVGHRLEEIFRVSDRITVLRDGALVDTVDTRSVSEEDVVRLMVGRSIGSLYDRAPATHGDVVIETRGLTARGKFSDITLTVRAGEVVGMAGLVGSGRTEVARALFGVERPDSGAILLDGSEVTVKSPARAIELGIAYVSEDRRGQSVVEDFSILDNASLPTIEKTTRWGIIRRKAEIALVAGPLERMRLKFHDYLQPIRTLSGGNQQKVVLAKWLATNPRVLILDEPTQGIDIQAKAEVHRIIGELAAQGIAILMISSDMPELLGACDRVYVMSQGVVAAELAGDEITQFNVGLAATRALGDDAQKPAADDAQPERSSSTAPPPAPRRTAIDALRRVLRRRETGLLIALALIIVPLSLINTNFYSLGNLKDLADYSALLGLVGIGQMLVILTRNIDLSVASTLGLSAYFAASTMRALPDAPVVAGIGVALITGLVCGLLNGAVVAYGRVPSIVVTLGTLALYRGALSIVSSGDRVKPEDVSDAWLAWTKNEILGISPVVLVAVGVAVVVGLVLFLTQRGRETYYSGSNPEGADLIGIPVQRRVLGAFAVSGLLAGATGALWASYYPYVDGQVAVGLETSVIAAVVVGGVALRGGSGTVVGVAFGTLGLLAIRKVLTIAGVPDQYLQAVYGAAIIVAVSVDVYLTTRAKRREVTR